MVSRDGLVQGSRVCSRHKLERLFAEVRRRDAAEKRPCLQDPSAETFKGQLFFNPAISGFDFLLTENKDAPREQSHEKQSGNDEEPGAGIHTVRVFAAGAGRLDFEG